MVEAVEVHILHKNTVEHHIAIDEYEKNVHKTPESHHVHSPCDTVIAVRLLTVLKKTINLK